LSLSELDIIDILGGHIPDYTYIEDIPIDILGEVIEYLTKLEYDSSEITFPDEINFDRKIKFNKLSQSHGKLLTSHFYQDHLITEYFSFNSKFAKEDLKTVFSNLYIEGLEIYAEYIPERSDLVFAYVLKKSQP
jgi:hypothetical protein